MEEKKKKERTIRSETTKVFLVIFAILVFVGIFTIGSSIIGSNNFSNIREVQLKQFRAVEVMKQQALDVIGIYYLLATDQDQEILMRELKRYDGLVESFEHARNSVILSYKDSKSSEKAKIIALLAETKQIFDDLNNSCRRMTFAMMGGDKKASAAEFPAIDVGIKKFKGSLDAVEGIVVKQLDSEVEQAQFVFKHTTRLGITIIVLAVFITIGLIYYLMKFLSVSLLPISNLMHNMRQAVFSIDKDLKVISPVSAYSSVVFGEEIVGKNINDIAYKEVDLKSEDYSRNKMALDVVFGADDLQWMLQEDGLMRQVSRTVNVDGSDQQRILKLSYTPLMQKDLVQNIMVVAEDVTEIELLRAESLAKQGELEIIKGVIDIDTNDLEAFLVGARAQIIECRGLLNKLEASKDSRQLMFRILHTLKGNSRMYNLGAISEVVHVAESSVVEINHQIDIGEPLTKEHIAAIVKGLDSIEDVLALHSKMARKFFGLKDLYSDRAEEQLNKAIASIEMAMDCGTDAATIKPLADDAFKAAEYFEKDSLSDVLSKLAQSGSDKIRSQVSDEYLNVLLQNGGIRVFALDASRWISLFHTIYDLSREFVADPNGARFIQAAQELVVLADAENTAFIRMKVLSFAEDKNHIAEGITSMWRFMAAVCAMESAYAVDNAQAMAIRAELIAPTENIDLDKITSARLLPVSLFRSFERKSIARNEFWQMAFKFLQIASIEEGVRAFIGLPDSHMFTASVIEHLKTGSAAGWARAAAFKDDFPLFELFKETHSSQLQLDVMRLLATYSKEGLAPFESEEQTFEITATCFNEIKTLAGNLASAKMADSESVQRLNQAVMHAFDYPIRSVCKKMEPMVYELSKRMGKDIQFSVTGENIAVARDSAYALRDALVHIIRNSLDHGIETPEERIAKGKNSKASLEIGILRKDKLIEISVRDDGRGIDADKLVKKAISMGNIAEADTVNLSREQRLQLVFVPNLSTKEEVTALSGRGVGMDAVKNTVDMMGGSIKVSSVIDAGTEFVMLVGDPSTWGASSRA